MPVLVKHAGVQCLLLSDTSTANTATTLLPDDKLASIGGPAATGMCVDMEAVYRGTSHQRRKAIVIADDGDETLLAQHPVDYSW